MLRLCFTLALGYIAFLTLVSADTYYIIPTHNITCPNENVRCLTITEFAAKRSFNTANITMTFAPGNHQLGSNLQVRYVMTLILQVENSNSRSSSSTAIVTCNGSGINFESMYKVSISGLEFNGCRENTVRSVNIFRLEGCRFHTGHGIKLERIENATIERSSFVNNTNSRVIEVETGYPNITISNSKFLANTGGVIQVQTGSPNITISNSKFIANTAQFGGVIATNAFSGNITICNSEIISNIAQDHGGAINVLGTKLNIYNSKFLGNKANFGGAISASNSNAPITIENSTFINNTADAAGGVIHIIKTAAILRNSRFINNTANSLGGVIYARRDIFIETYDSHFINNTALEGGGVIYALYFGTVTINSSYFINNTALEGGGAIDVAYQISLTTCDSHFENNTGNKGGAIRAENTAGVVTISNGTFSQNSAALGGAIYITLVQLTSTTFLHITNNTAMSGVVFAVYSDLILSGNTTFSNNNGSLYAFSSNVIFEGFTTITQNTINTTSTPEGGALTCLQSNISFVSTYELHSTVIISNNRVYNGFGGAILAIESKIYTHGATTIANNTALSGGGIYAYQSELNFHGQTSISNNMASEKGGGIYAVSTTTKLSGGELQFIENTAERGGGMCLELNAKLYVIKPTLECSACETNQEPLTDDCCNDFIIKRTLTDRLRWLSLEFTNNSADYGGALHISDNTNTGACTDQSTSSECFFQGLTQQSYSSKTMNVLNTYFTNNSASKSGGIIFGGLLDRCTVSTYAEVFNKYQNLPPFSLNATSYLMEVTDLMAEDIQKEFSSEPVRVCICNNGQPDCSYSPPSYQVKKGQKFKISLVAVDQVNNPVPALVRAFLSSHDGGLSEGQAIQSTTSDCTDLTYTVSSPHDSEQLVLYADGPCSNVGVSQVQISVEFLPCNCPIGFSESSQQSNCICDCDPDIYPEHITNCSYANESVLTRDNRWISYFNTSAQEGYLIYPFCPFDYCRPSTEQVWINLNVPNGADAQCAFNRSGKLCGSCEKGLSLSFGSSRCMPCSNNWLALLFVFAIAGVTLVAFILVCNLTVAVGTINGLIFYANILATNRATFFPFETPNFLTVFIAWVNLDFGFVICFYDEMDGYAKTWLQLAFPLYIIFLVVMVIVACKYSQKISKLLGKRNPIATLATLILLSYTKLIRTIISAWQFATLQYSNGDQERVWLVDANMHYFNRKHVPLFTTAFLVLMIGLGFTLFLFLWQWIKRSSDNVQNSKWFNDHFTKKKKKKNNSEKNMLSWIDDSKLFTFMDAYHNPCKMKHRYWIGGLLLIRVLLYLVSALNYSTNTSINLLAIISVIGGLIIWKDMVKEKVYKEWQLNALEDSFLYNLLIFSAATLYVKETGGNQAALAYTLTSIAFITFLAILIYHGYEYVFKPLKKANEDESQSLDPQNEEMERQDEQETSQPRQHVVDVEKIKKNMKVHKSPQYKDGDKPLLAATRHALYCSLQTTAAGSNTTNDTRLCKSNIVISRKTVF